MLLLSFLLVGCTTSVTLDSGLLPDSGDSDDTSDTDSEDTSDTDSEDTSDTDSEDTSDTDTSDTDTSDTDTDTDGDSDVDTDTSDTDTDTDTGPPTLPSCPSTHAKVGWTGTLYTHAWNVGGKATIANDCAILVENFTYDGGGKEVHIVGAKNGVWGTGMILEYDITGTVYSGETLVLELSGGRSLDDVDDLGVFDADLNIIFGEAHFAP